jgi:hypothetical protein
MITIKEEKLFEELDEETQQIIDACIENGFNKLETAFAVACYQDFDFTLEEVMEMIERNVINVSEYNSNLVENDVWSVEALVYPNQDEAIQAAIDYVEDLIDEIGYSGFNVDFADFADENWFKEALKESFETYCSDIEYESDDSFGNRLVQECYDNGIISDEDFATDEDGNVNYTECMLDTIDLVDRYVDWYETEELYGNYHGNFIKAYIDNFGEDDFNYILKNNPDIIDKDAFAAYCVEQDGPQQSLSSYDGQEYIVDIGDNQNYFVYRTN